MSELDLIGDMLKKGTQEQRHGAMISTSHHARTRLNEPSEPLLAISRELTYFL